MWVTDIKMSGTQITPRTFIPEINTYSIILLLFQLKRGRGEPAAVP